MSETQLMAKTLYQYPKQSITRELHELTFKSIFGSLRATFYPSPFYKFISLSHMVIYQLESLHLDDYNLIYSQNKNRGFYKLLTAFPFKTQHSLFFFTTIPTNQYNKKQPLRPTRNLPKTTPQHLYWWFGTSYNQP